MSLVRNERLKLFATYLNGLGIALFAVGGLAPSFAIVYGTAGNTASGSTALIAVGCLIGSVGLHYLGSLVLQGLRP